MDDAGAAAAAVVPSRQSGPGPRGVRRWCSAARAGRRRRPCRRGGGSSTPRQAGSRTTTRSLAQNRSASRSISIGRQQHLATPAVRRRSTSRRWHGRRRHGRSRSVRHTLLVRGRQIARTASRRVVGQAFVGDRPVGPVEASVDVEPDRAARRRQSASSPAGFDGLLGGRVSAQIVRSSPGGHRSAEPFLERRGPRRSRGGGGELAITASSTRRSPTRRRLVATSRPRGRAAPSARRGGQRGGRRGVPVQRPGVEGAHVAVVVDDGVGDDVVMVRMRVERPTVPWRKRRTRPSVGTTWPPRGRRRRAGRGGRSRFDWL